MSKHTKTRVIAMEVPCCHDCIIDCSKCSRLWARCAKTYRLILISNTHFAIEQSIGKHALRLEQTKSEVEQKIKMPAVRLQGEAKSAPQAKKFSRMSVDSEQRMAREGTHENGGFP